MARLKNSKTWPCISARHFLDRLAYLTTFSMKGWDSPDWQKNTLAYLEASFEKGAIGMKVWKNIGMVEKDKDGKFIMIDNPKFDTNFQLPGEKRHTGMRAYR